MNVGLYQSASALSALERWQDAVSQNITSSQTIGYRVTLAGTARPVVEGEATLPGDAATRLITIACPVGGRGCFHLSWEGPGVSGRNHYLAGEPTFSLANYRTWLEPLLHDDPTWRELVNEARE